MVLEEWIVELPTNYRLLKEDAVYVERRRSSMREGVREGAIRVGEGERWWEAERGEAEQVKSFSSPSDRFARNSQRRRRTNGSVCMCEPASQIQNDFRLGSRQAIRGHGKY